MTLKYFFWSLECGVNPVWTRTHLCVVERNTWRKLYDDGRFDLSQIAEEILLDRLLGIL